MRFSQFSRRLMPISVLVAVAIGFSACASLPAKTQVFNVHQGVHTALVAVDQTEAAVCQPDAVNPNTCDSKLISDAVHQAISAKIADAYRLDAKVSQAIQDWKPGDPVPAQIPALLADAQAIVASLGQAVGSSGLASLSAKSNSFVDEVAKFIAAIQAATASAGK